MNNSFDEQMKRLKEEYNRMPDQTTPDRIWAHVKQEKGKRRIRFSWLGAAAGTVAAASIAGLLAVSQFNLPFNDGDKGSEQAPYDERENEERENVEEEDPDENMPEEKERDPQQTRESQKEISYMNEGMEETSVFKLLDEPEFSFTTYIPEYFEVEVTENKEIQLYAAFNEDQEPTESPVWTLQEFRAENGSAGPLEEKIAEIQEEYEEEGYELVQEEHEENLMFGNYAATFEGTSNSYLSVILLENNGTVIKWEQSGPPEMADGLAAREQVVMEEWEWE
ncbi:hypothetical protein [Alteribacillus sp. YIM 98480]|uniref:hypothetical protein n=1 Tax=Alteribacillus sp. YIM 98480 TaxID=2606599 RepID=UPI00131BAA50|nr:hypothetical protein [Alteribacillus sp. YIM 98480]